MKILSNFDTNQAQKLRDQYAEQFGDDRVLIVRKSKLFYYQHIGLPWFGYFILLTMAFFFIYGLDDLHIGVEIWFWIIFLVLFLITVRKTIGHYINYKMDYMIATPNEIMKYDQHGVFGRVVEKLHADKIKSISVHKHGIVNSLFDIGSLHIMAEWDSDKWDIVMNYIDAVEAKEKSIVHILGLDS